MPERCIRSAPWLIAALLANQAAALEEITVTATRRPEPLVGQPGSVTRIGADALSLLGATHSSEALNRAAGALVQHGSGQESLTALRSPVLTGAGACGAVLVLEDGIPIRPVGSCNVNQLFEVNLEQAAAVEVLRGPGSALYGSSAVHGIINVLAPSPEQLPAAAISLESGSDDYRRLRLASAGHAGRARLGLAMHATNDAGWRADSGLTEAKLSASLAAPMGPGQLSLKGSATWLEQDTAGFIIGQGAYREPRLARSNPNPGAYRDAQSARLALHYLPDDDDEGFDFRAALRSSRMDFLQHFLLGQPTEANGQDSAVVLVGWRRATDAGGEWSAGADLEVAQSSLVQEQDGPTTGGSPAANAIRPAGLHYDYRVNSRMAAGYLQLQQPLAAGWRLQAGTRLEQVRYHYDNQMLTGNTDANGVPCPGGCLYSRPADRSDAFLNLAPRLALLWQPGPRTTAYLSLARGFRAPEATELYRLQRGQAVADLEPEHLDSAELGWRWRGTGLGIDAAVFHMDKRNVILRDSAGFTVTGGRTRHRGAELQFDWRVSGGWMLSGSGTLADHEYRFTAQAEQGELIVAGRQIDTAPRHLHSLRLRRDATHGAVELEWQQVGRYWADAANTAMYPGHDLLNLRASWRPAPAWSMTLRLTNLLDAAYADRADFAFGNFRYFPGRGRAAFLELAWQRLQSPSPDARD